VLCFLLFPPGSDDFFLLYILTEPSFFFALPCSFFLFKDEYHVVLNCPVPAGFEPDICAWLVLAGLGRVESRSGANRARGALVLYRHDADE
jgi:hypothetical protein